MLDDGKPIGRIYEKHAPASPDQAWVWSITEYVEPRSGLRTNTIRPPRITRLQTTSTGGLRARARRVAGCATSTGSAGHAGAQANMVCSQPEGFDARSLAQSLNPRCDGYHNL